MTRHMAGRGQGRKALPENDRAIVRSLRLTAAQWGKFQALGGVAVVKGHGEPVHAVGAEHGRSGAFVP